MSHTFRESDLQDYHSKKKFQYKKRKIQNQESIKRQRLDKHLSEDEEICFGKRLIKSYQLG